jgi:hypothetical protein
MQIDRTYLLSLDYGRLLSHMRKAAGLTPKASPYGNWEGKSWTIGHAMSALSMRYPFPAALHRQAAAAQWRTRHMELLRVRTPRHVGQDEIVCGKGSFANRKTKRHVIAKHDAIGLYWGRVAGLAGHFQYFGVIIFGLCFWCVRATLFMPT